jgi:sec-independent protein translocase protein TatA
MGSFSIWHWVVVLLIVLLLFGAKRIPELAKGLGSGIKNFKNAIKEDESEAVKTADGKPVEATARLRQLLQRLHSQPNRQPQQQRQRPQQSKNRLPQTQLKLNRPI